MIKRLIKIGFLTGLAHIFTIGTLKLLSEHLGEGQINAIGEADAMVQLILSFIAFGLQTYSVRNIAISNEHWNDHYFQAQTARFTFGLLLFPLLFLVYMDKANILFGLAPVLALNGDYALYGTGKAVTGAFISFIRVVIPSVCLIILTLGRFGHILEYYLASISFAYIITSIIISKLLKVPYFFKPKIKSLSLYLKSLSLGVVMLTSYIVGLGLIFIASKFYNSGIVAVSYLGLKFYLLFRGILRIINQAFVKQMINDEICVKVDKIAGMMGLSFCSALLLFPETIISMFFSEAYMQYKYFFALIGLAALISSIFVSLVNRILLIKKDIYFAKLSALASIISIIIVIGLSYITQSPLNIGYSLLIGESVLVIGLLKANSDSNISARFKFLVPCIALLSVPIIAKFAFGDSLWIMVISLSTYFAGMLLFYIKSERFLTLKTAAS